MSSKHRAEFYTREGRRRSRLPLDMVGPELTFGLADTLFSAGMGWAHLNVDAIRRLKDSTQLRFVFLCYDIIPLLFPQFYVARDVEQFREHFRVAFPIADRVIFTARRIECDARDYCHSNGLVIAATAIASLGTDAPRVPSASALPSELKPGSEFSPCLDPADEDAWYAKLKQWITDPTVRLPYENAIRARFHSMSWREAAERVLRTAEAESTDKPHLAPEVAK
jgi:hypothetical protein